MAWGIFKPFSWLGKQIARPFKYLEAHSPEIMRGLGIIATFAADYIPVPLLRKLVKEVGKAALQDHLSGQEKMDLVLASAERAALWAGRPFDKQKYRALIELLVAQLDE